MFCRNTRRCITIALSRRPITSSALRKVIASSLLSIISLRSFTGAFSRFPIGLIRVQRNSALSLDGDRPFEINRYPWTRQRRKVHVDPSGRQPPKETNTRINVISMIPCNAIQHSALAKRILLPNASGAKGRTVERSGVPLIPEIGHSPVIQQPNIKFEQCLEPFTIAPYKGYRG